MLRMVWEYMREKQAGLTKDVQTSVTFSGLAQDGMILFPVNKNEQQILNEKRASDTRRELMNAARKRPGSNRDADI